MEATPKTSSGVRTYALVFTVLAVITILEILLSQPGVGVARQVLTPTFLMFSLAKTGLVAAFFMHLRSDTRFYTYVFLFPAALLLIFALLATVR
jgi:caa(3)-type oxidase subunit IV